MCANLSVPANTNTAAALRAPQRQASTVGAEDDKRPFLMRLMSDSEREPRYRATTPRKRQLWHANGLSQMDARGFLIYISAAWKRVLS
jgi:hypothetical protein